MCGKCKNNSCSGGCCDPSLEGLASKIASFEGILNTLAGLVRFLKGHPIIAIDHPSDIAQFNASTGEGFNDWIGWGVCNGIAYPSPTGPVATPDLRDRFLTMAGGTYAVGDIGGANTVTLIIPQLPKHNHALTDPGHTHVVNDAGHTHGITDPGHTHAAVASPHQHSFTSDPSAHSHSYEDHERTTIWVGCIAAGPTGTVMYKNTSSTVPGDVELANDNDSSATRTTANATLTISGTTDQTTETVAISTSLTGIVVSSAVTGVTNQTALTGITLADTGDDKEHENRPPYYACIFVKKIF
jgi:microcystin-dependent protein